MQVKSNESEDVIDLYLLGRLSASELEDFEIRLIEDPKFFERVRQVEMMHAAFKEQEFSIETAINSHNISRTLSFALWLKQPMSLAASLLIVVGLALTGSRYLQQIDNMSAQSGYAINSVINIGQTRSTASDVVLTSDIHLLQVDVGIDMEQTAYQLSLLPENDGTRIEFVVIPDSNGIVRVVTPTGLSGSYQLFVQKENAGEPEASYQLRFE